MATTIRTLREATPARWQAALRRAIAEGVQVRQLAGCGAWIATSGTDLATAYEVGAEGCECHAGQFGDPICKHRAAYWHARGLLDLDPEPQPPTPAAPAPAPCWACKGSGREWIEGASGDWFHVACIACDGTGEAGEEGDEPADDTGGDAVTDLPRPSPHRGPTPAQVVALKADADALRHAVAHAAPLVDPFTGRVIDRHNCRGAA